MMADRRRCVYGPPTTPPEHRGKVWALRFGINRGQGPQHRVLVPDGHQSIIHFTLQEKF